MYFDVIKMKLSEVRKVTKLETYFWEKKRL